jgi:hypothetical protein
VTACRFTEKFEFLYGLLQLPDLDSAPSSCYARVFRRCSRIGSGPAVRCGFSACIGRLEHHHQRVRKAQRIFSVDFYQFVVTVRYADPDRSDKSPLVQAHVARNDSTDVYTAPEPLNTFGLPDLASRVVVGGSKARIRITHVGLDAILDWSKPSLESSNDLPLAEYWSINQS